MLSAAGSKYIQIPLNACLGEVIKNNGRFAVVGLPCHINGLRRLEDFNSELKEKIVLRMGLFCNHAVNYKGMVFLLNEIGVKPKDLIELRYRAKMKGTTDLYVKTASCKAFLFHHQDIGEGS